MSLATVASGVTIASAGYGLYNSIAGGGGGGGDGSSQALYPKIYTMPQYDFTEPRLRATSDFLQGNIERLSRGEYPDYYENALPSLRENMHRPNYETYYGRAGEPGVLRGQMDVGSITGIGPRKTQAGVERSLSEYATGEKQIDEYLTKMGVDIMNKDSYTFPALSSAMPKGPDAQLGYPTVVGGQQGNAASQGESFGNMLGGVADLAGGIAGLWPSGGGGSVGSGAQSSANYTGGYGGTGGFNTGADYGAGGGSTSYAGSQYSMIQPRGSNYGYGGVGQYSAPPVSSSSSGNYDFGLHQTYIKRRGGYYGN